MEVAIKELVGPGWWIFRRTVGFIITVNNDLVYQYENAKEDWRDNDYPHILRRGDVVITQREIKKAKYPSWSILRNGEEIATVTHRYGCMMGDLFDVTTGGITYKSFRGLASLSKHKCFHTSKWLGFLGPPNTSTSTFIDELDCDVAAMIALYELHQP